jgi:nicotinate-nucleotide adenylyltransferase
MKLGLLGGSFDPIHFGHLRAAENAREALALDQVAFVPASVPPHRRAPLTPARDRFAMVALATAGNPGFVACDLELERAGPSYTVDTLRALRALRPQDEVVLIVGADAFAEMASWREPEALFALCAVAVVERPGASLGPATGRPGLCVEGAGLPISATDIRKRVAERRSIRYLVPDGVCDYIAKRGLYR